jgi:hypothetical protein
VPIGCRLSAADAPSGTIPRLTALLANDSNGSLNLNTTVYGSTASIEASPWNAPRLGESSAGSSVLVNV